MIYAKKTAYWVLALGVVTFALLATVQAIEETTGDIQSGKSLYETNCLACHGVSGLGDGVAAAGLKKKPANLQQHLSVFSLLDIDVLTIPRIVLRGKEDEGMPAFADTLEVSDVQNIYAYLRSIR